MSQSPTATDLSPEDIKRLAALLEKHDLTELRFEEDDVRVTLRTAAYFRQQGVPAGAVLAAAPVTPSTEAREGELFAEDDTESEAPEATGVTIEAPIMGTFYHAASPDDPAFVEVGDRVEIGDIVGLIEAMKVFSEVKSEFAGVVQSIPAANKALVAPGDTLIVLTQE